MVQVAAAYSITTTLHMRFPILICAVNGDNFACYEGRLVYTRMMRTAPVLPIVEQASVLKLVLCPQRTPWSLKDPANSDAAAKDS